MVMLYVAGQKVAWADAEKLFAEAAATQPVEFHDETGRVSATGVPGSEPMGWFDPPTPTGPSDPRLGPGYTFEKMRKRLGWE